MPAATASDLEQAAAALRAVGTFSLDLETTGFNPRTDAIKGVSLSVGPGEGQTWWLPFRGEGALSQVQAMRALAPSLADERKTLVGSNCKFDLEFLATHHADVPVRCRLADTVVAHWLIDEHSPHGLKPLAERYLGVKMAKYAEAAVHDGGLFPEVFADYARDDARCALRLWTEHLSRELDRQGLLKLFHEVEMEIVRTLIEMETRGVAIDREFLSTLDAATRATRDAARAEALRLAGRPFDLDSPKDTSALLFGEHGLKPLDWMHRGKAGYYSTDDDVLTRYDDPLVAEILRYREASQTLKLYCAPYAGMSGDGRIYAEFNQAGTIRGRFSSSNPNLQQVTSSIKPLFVASPGKRLVGGDFNQLQFRLVGHFAKVILRHSKVAEAYLEGLDLHTKTQRELGFKDRKPAKETNFAFIFGRGYKSFAQANRKSDAEAKAYYDGFHRAYPEIRRMARVCRADILARGYVESIANRRLHFPDMLGKTETGERGDPTYWPGWVAWNAKIQGAEADLVRIVMRNIQREVDRRRAGDRRWEEAYLQIQVHDELIGEAPEALAEEFAALMKREAEGAVELEVPIIFEAKTGRTWKDIK